MAPLPNIKAVFIASGSSDAILQLANDQPDGTIQYKPIKGAVVADGNSTATKHAVVIKLPVSETCDETAVVDAISWLEKYRSTIEKCDDQKLLEFHTFLDSNTGSRTLNLPNNLVQLCAELGLDVASQAIRELTESECRDIFSSSDGIE